MESRCSTADRMHRMTTTVRYGGTRAGTTDVPSHPRAHCGVTPLTIRIRERDQVCAVTARIMTHTELTKLCVHIMTDYHQRWYDGRLRRPNIEVWNATDFIEGTPQANTETNRISVAGRRPARHLARRQLWESALVSRCTARTLRVSNPKAL